VAFRVRAGGRFEGRLARVTPRASKTPFHRALCGPVGGPIPVKLNEMGDASDDRYRFVEPRFTGLVELAPSTCRLLRAGQVGQVLLRSHHDAIGEFVYRKFTGWVRRKLEQARSRP
jgi:hypothetical protein